MKTCPGPALGMFEVFGRTGPPTLGGRILNPQNSYKLTFILPLIAMLTKEPEMLQPDAFCENTMQQNATAAGAPPWAPLRELTALPQTPSWF